MLNLAKSISSMNKILNSIVAVHSIQFDSFIEPACRLDARNHLRGLRRHATVLEERKLCVLKFFLVFPFLEVVGRESTEGVSS
jgi:hypothetical protein